MNTSRITLSIIAVLTLFLSACNRDNATEGSSTEAVSQNTVLQPESKPSVVLPVTAATASGANAIPYPVYPNGNQYKTGGENGLKVVLFETTDPFEVVDAYYQNIAQSGDMKRLFAMSDYVRYSSESTDTDPWATYKPGIVIHQFNDDTERRAVGAGETSKTNIIISF